MTNKKTVADATAEIEKLVTIIAKSEAIDFIEYMDKVADANHLNSDLLIKEVITYINRIRGEQDERKRKMTKYRKYKRVFKIACELLNGSYLYGYDADCIFEKMMKRDGVVSSSSYEDFIFKHLDVLSGKGG